MLNYVTKELRSISFLLDFLLKVIVKARQIETTKELHSSCTHLNKDRYMCVSLGDEKLYNYLILTNNE